jgi:hypothetical protein
MNDRGEAQCQPDVRKPFRTVLPFGCILSSTIPAEERHHEPRPGTRDEGGGEFKLTHYQTPSCPSSDARAEWLRILIDRIPHTKT